MVSENIANRDSQRTITEAFEGMGRTGRGRALVRRDSIGNERRHFEELMGTDNGASYMQTVGRNSDHYRDYDLDDITIIEGPEYGMIQNFGRRRR